MTDVGFDDRTADTVIDGDGGAISERRADLVRSRAVYTPTTVAFTVQTAQPNDPAGDPSWAGAATYVSWEIDTNGDAVPDFEVQFARNDEGDLVAGVIRPGAEGEENCESEAAFSPEGYSVGLESACIGNPPSFSYRVTIYYDTDPSNDEAPVATDVAPDGGLSRPVARPA